MINDIGEPFRVGGELTGFIIAKRCENFTEEITLECVNCQHRVELDETQEIEYFQLVFHQINCGVGR